MSESDNSDNNALKRIHIHQNGNIFQKSCFIIKEVYENGSSLEFFEQQLDYALESKVGTIIIEPQKLGLATAQWIHFGKVLQQFSVVCGIGSISSAALFPDKPLLYLSLTGLSISLSSLYFISWHMDTCSRYIVTHKMSNINRHARASLTTSNPIILIRLNSRIDLFLYASVTLTAAIISGFQILF